jgi:hypothetical protein
MLHMLCSENANMLYTYGTSTINIPESALHMQYNVKCTQCGVEILCSANTAWCTDIYCTVNLFSFNKTRKICTKNKKVSLSLSITACNMAKIKIRIPSIFVYVPRGHSLLRGVGGGGGGCLKIQERL